MQNGHGRESGGCAELEFSKQMSSGGRLSWMPLKVLLYDDLVGVVTSHVTKMAVTPLDPPWPKPPVVPKLHSSVFYIRLKFMPIEAFHCVNMEFRLFIAKNG